MESSWLQLPWCRPSSAPVAPVLPAMVVASILLPRPAATCAAAPLAARLHALLLPARRGASRSRPTRPRCAGDFTYRLPEARPEMKSAHEWSRTSPPGEVGVGAAGQRRVAAARPAPLVDRVQGGAIRPVDGAARLGAARAPRGGGGVGRRRAGGRGLVGRRVGRCRSSPSRRRAASARRRRRHQPSPPARTRGAAAPPRPPSRRTSSSRRGRRCRSSRRARCRAGGRWRRAARSSTTWWRSTRRI